MGQRQRDREIYEPEVGQLAIGSVNGPSLEQRARPVGQSPVGIVGVPVPAGSLSLPSVEHRRVCSNLLETAAQPRPDLKGIWPAGQAWPGLYCSRERERERVRERE